MNRKQQNGRSRVSRGNKMQKQKKFRASEYRAKFTWTMLSAAEILYQKKTASIAHVISENWHETAPKGARKKLQEISCKRR